jgi:hypothetical protein
MCVKIEREREKSNYTKSRATTGPIQPPCQDNHRYINKINFICVVIYLFIKLYLTKFIENLCVKKVNG